MFANFALYFPFFRTVSILTRKVLMYETLTENGQKHTELVTFNNGLHFINSGVLSLAAVRR